MDEQSEALTKWNVVASEVFGERSSAHLKGYPKNAFLGLCDAGMVKGIGKGNYAKRSTSQKNKGYAIKAVQLLTEKPELTVDKLKLWNEVTKGVNLTQNSQMNLVIALWKNNLIVLE